MKTVREIQEQFAREEVEFSDHAARQMRKRGIRVEELFEAVRNAESIEAYPDDKYGASLLLLGSTLSERPLHILVTAFERPLCKVVTAYQPDDREWNFYRIRKPKS
jgi:Domain of unknown function (DUF4258)